MLKIFLNLVVGLSCVLMMSCSAKISPASFTQPWESHIVDNHDGTFTVSSNSVQWTKDDSTPGPSSCLRGLKINFWLMNSHVDCLNRNKYLGYNDWRTPTYQELEYLLDTTEMKNRTNFNHQIYERLMNHEYWSTADLAVFIYVPSIMIYNVKGPKYIYNRVSDYYVWPVRSKNNVNMVASFKLNQ